MRRTLTDAELRWAETLHIYWTRQCEAEGMPVPAEPIDSVIQAAQWAFMSSGRGADFRCRPSAS